MASSTPPAASESGAGGFQLFNLATMSGIYPGTRTMVFQRLRLRLLDDPESMRWARLLWYENPPACVVELDAHGGEAGHPIVRLSDPLVGDLRRRLAEALAAAGWQWVACGSCAFWQLPTSRTADNLPAASCTYHSVTAGTTLPAPLAAQSLLALDCLHWQPTGSAYVERIEPTGAAAIIQPLAKRAERESDERWTWWGRLRRALAQRSSPQKPGSPKVAPGRPAGETAPDFAWEHQVFERSGVGAGTEPCFACQGRVANLGALVVASPEGDKQTLSIWRCRACFTYYLNDWIDRWERTDSLETEESYYRLAPQEALEVLALIDNVVHAEHPAGRFERAAQRAWVLAFIAQHPRLSHQIKQGR